MFVRYYTELEAPIAEVRAVAASQRRDWLPRLVEQAEDRAERLLVEVGLTVAGLRFQRQGVLETSAWQPTSLGGARMHVGWRAERNASLFPAVDGELELAGLGADRTQLSLSANYEPPLGWLGRRLDQVLLHRVAEAVAKDFVEAAAAQLSASLAAAPTPD